MYSDHRSEPQDPQGGRGHLPALLGDLGREPYGALFLLSALGQMGQDPVMGLKALLTGLKLPSLLSGKTTDLVPSSITFPGRGEGKPHV